MSIDYCGSLATGDASVQQSPVFAGLDAGSATLLSTPSDTTSCRGGVYVGRFSCGGAEPTLTGEVVLALAAVAVPATLHTEVSSALRGDDTVLGGRIAVNTQGTVDCSTGNARFDMTGAYLISCLEVPLAGEMTGFYDATHNVLRGRILSLHDRDQNLATVALDCVWCASADPTGANCL